MNGLRRPTQNAGVRARRRRDQEGLRGREPQRGGADPPPACIEPALRVSAGIGSGSARRHWYRRDSTGARAVAGVPGVGCPVVMRPRGWSPATGLSRPAGTFTVTAQLSGGRRARRRSTSASRPRTGTGQSTSTPPWSRCSVSAGSPRSLLASIGMTASSSAPRTAGLSVTGTPPGTSRLPRRTAGLNGEGLRPVSAHLLRHTFASRLIALGLDVVEVARQLGDKPDTLLRIYAQVFNDARRRDEVRQRITEGTKIAL